MQSTHFTPEFATIARESVSAWKDSNTDAADALRALEKLCASHGEEFHPDGTPLVEEIYDGKFDGGQASSFIPNSKPAKDSTATPVTAETSATPTPVHPVDAKAVSKTPDSRFDGEADIASKAATSTQTAPGEATTKQ